MSADSPVHRRRVLIKGLDLDQITVRIRAYEELDDAAEQSYSLVVRGPTAEGWIQVDVPGNLELYHFHNLGKWFEGVEDEDDDPAPDALLLVDQGDDPYWLKPCGVDGGGSVLSGRKADHARYAYDLAGGEETDDARFDSVPMSIDMAMMTSGVPMRMHGPDHEFAVSTTLDFTPWEVDGGGVSPLVMKVLSWFVGRK